LAATTRRLDQIVEPEEQQRQPNILQRTPRNLYRFTRRKPLGAFGGFLIFILVFMAVFGAGFKIGPLEVPPLAPYHYNEYQLLRNYLQSPSWSHIMGTDELGRDVFSRILHGARLSVFIGLGVFSISITLQTTLSVVSAYYVTTIDLILQRLIDIFGFLPDLVILISLMAVYGANPVTLIVTLGILNGVNTSRVLRSLVIGIRGLPYIESAKAIGASDTRVIVRHIMPNVAYYVIIQATGAISAAIAAEAGLAIIGLGLDPSYPTWGNMMNASREFLRTAPHLAVAPGLMLALTIFGFRLLGDALRDVLDPRLRGSR
jgi:peptide/nickel transport system permease protein